MSDNARQTVKRAFVKPIAAAALLASILFGCATLTGLNEAPRVTLASIEPVDFQLIEQRFRVRLRVQNPNDRDITIRGLDYQIVINEKIFAEGVSGKPVSVPAWGEGIAEIEVVSSLERVIDQLKAFGERTSPDIDYALSGHVRVDGIPFPIPFQYSDTLTIPGAGGREDDRRDPPPRAISI